MFNDKCKKEFVFNEDCEYNWYSKLNWKVVGRQVLYYCEQESYYLFFDKDVYLFFVSNILLQLEI